ncbi:T9SS type A sorting domain-containing protein [Chryseobacterium lactis]|uniref:T9SS type A sorting domain-containing protein n=1 Tax=Chryseobacterium lactis TaxID=1241981 RepID=UPI00162402AC|nr:T9SS type A sorting domain-containing protein [Chryseobacterium lactis]
MKTKILILCMLILGTGVILAQGKENDNWLFGNNKWHFDNTATNGFVHTTNLTPYIRYGASVINNKNTGELLFFSNGYSIFNKNNVIMQDGNELFGPSNVNWVYELRGNPSDQSSIIVPIPGSSTKYYVFFINGNRKQNDDDNFLTYTSNTPTNYGFGYAVVDLSFNGGLGKVLSKGMLFTNSGTNALTSTLASDGNSYWIVTANNGNFLSYKVDANGLNTNPVVSPAPNQGNFFKISPDSKKLLTRQSKGWPNNGIFLYDFNNTTGSITNSLNIAPYSMYIDNADYVNSAEFSSDSNIVYFTISTTCLCSAANTDAGMAMYNISTGQLVGYTHNGPNSGFDYPFILKGASASLQRAKNGKIYLIQAIKSHYDPIDKTELVKFGNTYSYDWGVINTPNVWNTSVDPVTLISSQKGTMNGFSFPQLIPSSDDVVNPCPDILTITTPVTSSQNYQAGKSILASSKINANVTVNYKAGKDVNLLPGFFVDGNETGVFKAYIGPCSMTSLNREVVGNINSNSAKTVTVPAFSEVKVYPNPASDFIKIQSEAKVTAWELYDLSGKMVLKGEGNTIDVKSMVKGAYALNITLEKGTRVTKKIIVK